MDESFMAWGGQGGREGRKGDPRERESCRVMLAASASATHLLPLVLGQAQLHRQRGEGVAHFGQLQHVGPALIADPGGVRVVRAVVVRARLARRGVQARAPGGQEVQLRRRQLVLEAEDARAQQEGEE